MSASYISVKIKTDVTLNALQVINVQFAAVETVSSCLCTEDMILMDVVMLREMPCGLSHAKKRVFFLCSIIKLYCICWIENKWNVDCFVLKKNDRNIFSIFV